MILARRTPARVVARRLGCTVGALVQYRKLRRDAVLRRNRVMGMISGRLPIAEGSAFDALREIAHERKLQAIEARMALFAACRPEGRP